MTGLRERVLRIPARLRLGMVVAYDLVLAGVAFYGTLLLRYDQQLPAPLQHGLPGLLLLVVLSQGVVFQFFGLYRGFWRFASLHDLIAILKAVTVAVPVSALVIFLFNRLELVPRSAFFIDWLVLVFAQGGARFAYRIWKDGMWQSLKEGPRTLIIGAGAGGAQLLREIQRNRDVSMQVLGLVDDDPDKRGRSLMGVQVLGGVNELPDLVQRLQAEQVLVAIPSASARQMRRILALASKSGARVKTLPGLAEFLGDKLDLRSLRDIVPEDLLGREKVELDTAAIGHLVAGKCVLVSGAGGSIGSELCRSLLAFAPGRLVLVDQSEYLLYRLELELNERHLPFPCHFLVADVCDGGRMEAVFEDFRPDLVLHAAAYKHVPMMEANVASCLQNNLGGTLTLARLAGRCGSGNFVLVSTDKAVNPTNVMGASKRIAEMICQSLQPQFPHTHFTIVRFGNVLGSMGSVVPRFLEQIRAGGPVTVTHPEITRYFMSTAEATQLILQAATLGRGGEIFVLDMGEAVRIAELAESLIRLAGKRPGEEIEIVYTGLRPGEKLYEELLVAEENSLATPHPKIFVARARAAPGSLLEAVERLLNAGGKEPEAELRAWLRDWVPEYRPADPAMEEPPKAGAGLDS